MCVACVTCFICHICHICHMMCHMCHMCHTICHMYVCNISYWEHPALLLKHSRLVYRVIPCGEHKLFLHLVTLDACQQAAGGHTSKEVCGRHTTCGPSIFWRLRASKSVSSSGPCLGHTDPETLAIQADHLNGQPKCTEIYASTILSSVFNLQCDGWTLWATFTWYKCSKIETTKKRM